MDSTLPLPSSTVSRSRDVFHFLNAETVQEVLIQAACTSPIFATRWRWDANRSLALLRFQGGKKVPPQIQRMRADDLLASVFPDVAACQENIVGDIQIPKHPLVDEVMKDVLHEAMDINGLKNLLSGMADGRIRCVAVDTPVPSQFSHEILNANPYAYLDDAPLEERRARAVEMRRILPESVLEEVGRLDPAAIAQVREEAWPDVRDADELHDVLHTLIALPVSYRPGFAGLDSRGRLSLRGRCSSRMAEIFSILAGSGASHRRLAPRTVDIGLPLNALNLSPCCFPTRCSIRNLPKSMARLLPGKMYCSPSSRDGCLISGHDRQAASRPAGLQSSEIEQALLRMEASGAILRGKFTDAASRAGAPAPHDAEWCDRRLLARIHRLTVATLRKQIQPVTSAQFMKWLLRWQRVAPGSQMQGSAQLWKC